MKSELEIYTPSSLLAIFQSAFNIKQEKKLILMEGFYHKSGKKNYNGFYYDRISDSTNQFLTLKITNEAREILKEETVYTFSGNVERRVRPNGTIDITFVSAINQLPKQVRQSVMQNNADLKQLMIKRSQKPMIDFEKYFKDRIRKNVKPVISLIYGSSSKILSDVYSSLGNQKQKYSFNEYGINLNSIDNITNKLSDMVLNSSDIVAFVRGGGEGVEIFNDYQIAKKALEIQPQIISAIGHAEDETLLDLVADKKFDTPTALGNYLNELAKSTQQINFKKIAIYALYIGIGLIIGFITSKYLF